LSPRVVSAAEWLAARKELLAEEEQATRALQQIAARRRDGDTVLHTWSGYGAATDLLSGNDVRLDLTPLGRQDETADLLHHHRYPEEAR
jgi:predicted dithiol-disulfide oxidoreductase (DUF899 family)